ncbi:hypothetical protein H2248_004653 [Termitomyces sp. 'cryptogamus']|nr:hypothetical protein H2248_004653 [Termitomyces sp. 'cryptogamus']
MATSTSASAIRKARQHVYVFVPQSPYPTAPSSQKTNVMPRLNSLALKENTPLRPFNGGAPRLVDETPVLKRKVPEDELSLTKAANPKKQKLGEDLAAHAAQHRVNAPANVCPEFPNGFIYCHQCSKKRDVANSVHCTWVKAVKGVEKLCNVKICDRCLKKHYGQDPDQIKAVDNSGVYTFKCPRCLDMCSCWRCRKLKGLSSAGKPSANKPEQTLTALSPAKSTKSMVEVLITSTPSRGLYSKVFHPTVKAVMSQVTEVEPSAINMSTKAKVGAKTKQQTLRQMLPQSLPKLKWTKVPTILDLHDAKSRLQIREFILRFASVMEPSIPRAQLAELDDLGCGPDDDEMAPWVSEACVRSVILGLLGILVTLEGDIQKHIRSAVRDIRATGNNLNKIWPILAKLQDVNDDNTQLSFPDPLPLPTSVVIYNTRMTRSNGGPTVSIGHTAQMVPVLEALIEATLSTPIVREELDNGFKEAKEVIRGVQRAIREENERWDAERKSFEVSKETSEEALKVVNKIQGEQIRSKRDIHKFRIRDLENALRLVIPGFAPRFAPLGTDKAGRVYWIPSPGVVERKTALDFIASATVGKKGKARIVDDTVPTKWSWFVAVWGRKIPVAGNEAGDERWWAFTDPVEIRKVANWIRIDARIDPDGDADANKPLALLVKGLYEYAQLLDWRLKEDKYGSVA